MLQNGLLKVAVGLGKVVYRNRFHSNIITIVEANMKIKLLPALKDNYMYLLIDTNTNEAAVIDPVEPQKVFSAVEEEKVNLTSVLTTHHHWDHSGGNTELAKLFKNKLQFYGGDSRIPETSHQLKDKDTFKIGSLNVECFATPCHTTGHLCYYVNAENKPSAVFTGDTLFVGGCGRFFEGTADQMNYALNEVLANLPDETKVYCGHEYTVNNLKYALHVEPENQVIKDKLSWAKAQRDNKETTIPSTIGEEKTYNPFMRVNKESNLPTTTSQSAFLGNNRNKTRLIQTLTQEFNVKQAESDVETLIVETALQMAEVSDCNQPVVVVGNDTDLLVMLVARATSSMDIYMVCHNNPIMLYSIQQLQQALGSTKRCFPFIHAMTGCDATSSLYGQGKIKALKLVQKHDANLALHINVFSTSSSTQEDVATAGEQFLLSLYGAERFSIRSTNTDM
ncbi:Hydroxyacylglutathione hydrolase, mitochondrial [Nymphon striatum]|nr:Hydroxyacylglutathione hydrolase, mitochondrial [Nymphon striatum]